MIGRTIYLRLNEMGIDSSVYGPLDALRGCGHTTRIKLYHLIELNKNRIHLGAQSRILVMM